MLGVGGPLKCLCCGIFSICGFDVVVLLLVESVSSSLRRLPLVSEKLMGREWAAMTQGRYRGLFRNNVEYGVKENGEMDLL